jgi:hypothetical protein
MPAWTASPAARLDRRCLMQAGTLGLLGSLGLPHLATASTDNGFGRAKQCLFLFMWGGPSQLDTFDPKPEAPLEVRGPFGVIDTNVPGLRFSEHFRRVSQQADKLALLRSLSHDDPAHLSSVHTLLTGQLPPVNKSDAEPPSDRDTPHLGCVISHLWPAQGAMPSFVTMPWIVSHPAAPGGRAPGQHGGWLGHQYDPFVVGGDPNEANWQVPALALIEGQSRERLGSRRQLLDVLDRERRHWDDAAGRQVSLQQAQALGLLTSAAVRSAFDLQQESPATRDRYGRNLHGQCVLLGRRLLDHGVPVVSINWHNDGRTFWDTHSNNFNRLKNDLIPPADQALAAVLEDLSASGRLDETLVVWVGEFGRAPKITTKSSGREHHPGCYCGLLAGGGVRGGQVYGGSDAHAEAPADLPTSPQDVTATVYHALGVPPETVLYDALHRPHRLSEGQAITALF